LKLFYFHVPKTAGTSINEFLGDISHNFKIHIESSRDLNSEFLSGLDFASGHVRYPDIEKMIALNKWTTIATFREPIDHVISHLKWIKKLGEPSEHKRLLQHTKAIQKIVNEIMKYDLGNAQDISKFIQWLETNNIFYFHDTQTRYFCDAPHNVLIDEEQMEYAIRNIKKIDYVGLQENLSDFMKILSYEFGKERSKYPYLNMNDSDYGLNSEDNNIIEALAPLYNNDKKIYEYAKKMFVELYKKYHCSTDYNIKWHIDKVERRIVKGWAFSSKCHKKITINIYNRNGIKIASDEARIYRAGLKQIGKHPTGLCGFEIKIQPQFQDDDYLILTDGANVILHKPDLRK